MKRLSFVTILTVMLVCGINAQILNQANVAVITLDPAADPVLCVFGKTIDDVTLLAPLLDLNGKGIRYLRQREEADVHQIFKSEMERLNAGFMCLYIIQRRWVENNGKIDITTYFIVQVCERVNNRYYLVASNEY